MADRLDPGFFATVYTTRALRRFRPDPIPDEALFQVLDAAVRAPSGHNAQDWRFLLVRDADDKRRLREWGQEAWRTYRPEWAEEPSGIDDLDRTARLSWRSVEHLVHHLDTAPVIVVVCGLRGRHSTPGGSAFPAVQNLLLAARALGLGGSIFNLPLRDRDRVAALLDIPDTNEIHCLLPLGYPQDAHGPVRRKPVAKVVYDGRFGKPWAFAEEQAPEGWGQRWTGA